MKNYLDAITLDVPRQELARKLGSVLNSILSGGGAKGLLDDSAIHTRSSFLHLLLRFIRDFGPTSSDSVKHSLLLIAHLLPAVDEEPLDIPVLGDANSSLFDRSMFELLLVRFLTHSDHRIRLCCLEAFEILHGRFSGKINRQLYPSLKYLIQSDINPQVRARALAFLSLYIFDVPQQQASDMDVDKPGMSAPIVDTSDAFVVVSSAVGDTSPEVRASACEIIGNFLTIPLAQYKQALSKTPLSYKRGHSAKHVNKKPKANESPIDMFVAEGDFSVTETTSFAVTQLACGSIIHGLEDEYEQVRLKAVLSIQNLCRVRREFIPLSFEYLIDMFNDEIDDVRFVALTSMLTLSKLEVLAIDDEQLNTVFGVLNDAKPKYREKARELLSNLKLPSDQFIPMVFASVLPGLAKFPKEKTSIYRFFHKFGEIHHVELVSHLEGILEFNPNFDSRPKHLFDHKYLCMLIAVTSASERNPALANLLPEHVVRHVAFLKEMMPEYLETTASSVNDTYEKTLFAHSKMTIEKFGTSNSKLLDKLQKNIDGAANSYPPLLALIRILPVWRAVGDIKVMFKKDAFDVRIVSNVRSLVAQCHAFTALFSNLAQEDVVQIKSILDFSRSVFAYACQLKYAFPDLSQYDQVLALMENYTPVLTKEMFDQVRGPLSASIEVVPEITENRQVEIGRKSVKSGTGLHSGSPLFILPGLHVCMKVCGTIQNNSADSKLAVHVEVKGDSYTWTRTFTPTPRSWVQMNEDGVSKFEMMIKIPLANVIPDLLVASCKAVYLFGDRDKEILDEAFLTVSTVSQIFMVPWSKSFPK